MEEDLDTFGGIPLEPRGSEVYGGLSLRAEAEMVRRESEGQRESFEDIKPGDLFVDYHFNAVVIGTPTPPKGIYSGYIPLSSPYLESGLLCYQISNYSGGNGRDHKFFVLNEEHWQITAKDDGPIPISISLKLRSDLLEMALSDLNKKDVKQKSNLIEDMDIEQIRRDVTSLLDKL